MSYCFFCHWNLTNSMPITVSSQELGELQEAKQVLIQQKLELQAQVEAAQGALKQEQKEHQTTKDGRSEREEQLLAQIRDAQDQLVGSQIPRNTVLGASLLIPFSDTVNSSIKRQQRRRDGKSRWNVGRRQKLRWVCRWQPWMKTWPRWRGNGRAASGESANSRNRRMSWEEKSLCWRPPCRTTRTSDGLFWKGELILLLFDLWHFA